MTTAYSTNLELALPVQGELSGTWGDTVNNGITQYLDAAIAGSQIISGSQTAVTLTNTNGDATATNIAQAGSGATGTAQYQIIRCTGNPAGLLTVTISDTGVAGYSKTFVIINATSTSQSVKIVGSGPTTGITVASGDKALVAWNGSDFVRVGASAGGSDTQVQFNSSGNLAGSANLTFDGTNLSTTGQFISTKTGSSTDASGQVYLNGATSNRIDFNSNGTGAPAFTTRSAGTKLVLFPSLSGSVTDYAMGISAATMWSSVPENNGSFTFKWYGATTEVASLSGTGTFTANTLTPTNALGAAYGGTGLTSTTAYSVVFSGTTGTGAFQASAGPGTATHVLTSNGAGALPTFQALPASGLTRAQVTSIAMLYSI
jgi:hypothetical protein